MVDMEAFLTMAIVIVELKLCRQLFIEQSNGRTNDVRLFKILDQSKSFVILIGLLKRTILLERVVSWARQKIS